MTHWSKTRWSETHLKSPIRNLQTHQIHHLRTLLPFHCKEPRPKLLKLQSFTVDHDSHERQWVLSGLGLWVSHQVLYRWFLLARVRPGFNSSSFSLSSLMARFELNERLQCWTKESKREKLNRERERERVCVCVCVWKWWVGLIYWVYFNFFGFMYA